MTETQTFNRSDLEQTPADLERVRRDRVTSPGASPAAFVTPGGAAQAVPGDLAPFSRSMPFPTPEQDYGRQEQLIGFVTPLTDPSDTPFTTLPVLDVENWRAITFTLRYTAGAANGQLAVTPLYGNDEKAFPLPLFVPATTLTADGEYGYRLMYKEQFRTPLIPINNTFEVKLTFDVSAYRIFALSVRELNADITCTDEGEDPPVCSNISLRYSLSM